MDVCGKLIWTENCSDLRELKKSCLKFPLLATAEEQDWNWILLCMYISFVYIVKVLSNAEGEITTREVFNEFSRL